MHAGLSTLARIRVEKRDSQCHVTAETQPNSESVNTDLNWPAGPSSFERKRVRLRSHLRQPDSGPALFRVSHKDYSGVSALVWFFSINAGSRDDLLDNDGLGIGVILDILPFLPAQSQLVACVQITIGRIAFAASSGTSACDRFPDSQTRIHAS